MRTSKTVSISMPPAQLKAAERLARKQNRTMSELMREAFRRYAEESARQEKLAELGTAVASLRTEAELTGAAKLTMRQIDSEIAAARRQSRRKEPVTNPVR
jgi:metal-responsive CopG/Arc/MetJ family transcriptional regulator